MSNDHHNTVTTSQHNAVRHRSFFVRAFRIGHTHVTKGVSASPPPSLLLLRVYEVKLRNLHSAWP
jgi:hypothetical protein